MIFDVGNGLADGAPTTWRHYWGLAGSEEREAKRTKRKKKKAREPTGAFLPFPRSPLSSTTGMSRAQATSTVHQPHLQRQRHSGG